jgi:hypothetical protein
MTAARSELHPDAHALTAFRILPNGEGRQYTATTFPAHPWAGCERMLRMARAVGWVGRDPDESYALLEVLNIDADIIQDFPVPTAAAFRQLKKRLNLAVELEPAE